MSMQGHNCRVVLDTNVIVGAGSRWLDYPVLAANRTFCLRVVIRVLEAHTGIFCEKIVREYALILLERNHPEDRARRLITYLMGAFTKISITSASAPTPPADPDDEVFLLCAIDGNADYLVSEDRDLTDLKASYARPVIGRSEELAVPLGA
ncbi:PIN domain-containing protein [Synechococcus sp. CCAP 1479/9]|uniref:PIN domain-containing protein n=1 Tax=Synechococcus sp. CCAP 1479/9 TaxID=1221593 RepID=UPI00336A6D5A